MIISSPVFKNMEEIPSKYTCQGENINPPLEFSDVPDGTKSLVLIVDDPDAPMGTWTHWLIWGIDPSTTAIQENSLPGNAIEGTTDFGKSGYGGPCPPSGTHRYFFKLYALRSTLNLTPESTKEKLIETIENDIIDNAELVGLYKKV